MRTLVIISLLCLPVLRTFAQVQTQVIGDSIHLHGNTGTAELRLENSTDTVPGFLYNKGGGRTEFRRGLVRISDAVYLIGADTLRLSGIGGGGFGGVSSNTVYYVSRQYSGPGHAVVKGYTLASITSPNASYIAQLNRAVPGNRSLPYPDPISARNAALDAMKAGTISSAQVVVLSNNAYTIGSDDSTKNGSIDGLHPNNGTIADVGFADSLLVADTSLSSLMKNKLDMYFGDESSVTYINSAYPIFCCFDRDSTAFTSGIYGLGTFNQVYGEVNKFTACFVHLHNPAAVVDFRARQVALQQWQCFNFADYAMCNVDIDNILATDCNIFTIGDLYLDTVLNGNLARAPRQLSIHVKNIRFGKGQTPYPDSQDIWYMICLGKNAAVQGTQARIHIGNLFMNATNYAPLFYVSSSSVLYGVHMTVNIDNLLQRDSKVAYDDIHGGLMYCYGPGMAVNNDITYNIGSADIDAPLLGMMNFTTDVRNKHNTFNINVGDLVKHPSAFPGGLLKITGMLSQYAGEPLRIKIRGNFRSLDSNALIYAYNNWYSFPFASRYEFSGRYETLTPGIPVAHFYTNTGKVTALTDAFLINDGVTPSILADSTCNGLFCNCCQMSPTTPINIPLYLKNVHANAPASPNITTVGDALKVYADLPAFFNH